MVGGSKGTVLIVGSRPNERDTLGSRLRGNGYIVEAATGGFHSLSLLEQKDHYFQLAIILGDLEDTSALETIINIRTLLPKSELPILLINDSEEPALAQEGLKAGACDTARQSSSFVQILEKMESLISN